MIIIVVVVAVAAAFAVNVVVNSAPVFGSTHTHLDVTMKYNDKCHKLLLVITNFPILVCTGVEDSQRKKDPINP